MYRKIKEEVIKENLDLSKRNDKVDSALDAELSITELKIALNGTACTATEQDQLSYAMFLYVCKLPNEVLIIYWNYLIQFGEKDSYTNPEKVLLCWHSLNLVKISIMPEITNLLP